MTEGEEVLGLGSANRVWRVGGTIRRSRWLSSDTTAALLRHLEHKGFRYSPRYLGIDGLGRDVLSLLPGTPMASLRGDDQLVQVAGLLREFHDATADFTAPPGAVWQVAPVPAVLGGGRIIHRDVAAWNLLETGGVITGQVDWDLAGPGRLIEDFAYLAWHFTPLHPEPMGDGSSGPGDEVSARLWRAGRFTENTGRSLSWLAKHRESLTRALG